MKIPISSRMEHFLAPGVFTELAERRRALEAEGRQVIDLSIGSPDLPPSLDIREAVSQTALKPWSYGYSLGDLPELRRAAQSWYYGRYGVLLDPERELLGLSGAQDGLVHFLLAFTEPGDKVLVPDPCFPAVMTGVRLAGAEPVFLPLREENGFLIDFPGISPKDAAAAKVIFVSYPNNPTGATAPDSFYRDLIAFAAKYGILVLHDNAYSDMVFDGPPGRSFLEFEGAKDVGVELNSLSKSYSIPGARMAFLAGNAGIVSVFARLKSSLDLGAFYPAQRAAIAALTGDQADVEDLRRLYARRRDVLTAGLREAGLSPAPCRGSLFIWSRLPEGIQDDRAFVLELLARSGVLLAPGSAFGSEGRGRVRASLMCREPALREAARRIGESGLL